MNTTQDIRVRARPQSVLPPQIPGKFLSRTTISGNLWDLCGVSKGQMICLAFTFFLLLTQVGRAQTPKPPDIEAQRAAMKKLDFLLGEWSGDASAARGPGVVVEMNQSESAQFKLDGLVLMIEGIGRAKSDGSLALQALGLISFDDASGNYRMRAYNDGRWLETEVKLLEGGNGMSWGFTLGDISTKSIMRINDKGEWTERAEITIGTRQPQKLMDLVVRRMKRKS